MRRWGWPPTFKFRLALRDPSAAVRAARGEITFSEAPVMREGRCNTADAGVCKARDAAVARRPGDDCRWRWPTPSGRSMRCSRRPARSSDQCGGIDHNGLQLPYDPRPARAERACLRQRHRRLRLSAARRPPRHGGGRLPPRRRQGPLPAPKPEGPAGFSAVLSRLQRRHADHLHLDEAAWGMCAELAPDDRQPPNHGIRRPWRRLLRGGGGRLA